MRQKIYLLFLFVFVFGIVSMTSFDYGAIPASERAALIAIYNSTDGDNWAEKNGWKTAPLDTDGFAMPGTEGDWFGVTVSEDMVTMLNLWANKLNGTIPPQLGNLTNLFGLYISANKLKGAIPSQLGNLSKLVWLDLSYNELTGNIPPEFSNLSNLQDLRMSWNQLSGPIPAALYSPMSVLDLSGNQLSGSIPMGLGNFHYLRLLALNDNQ
ncbi:MAG: hypothetical protein QG657_2179, partial [Acidobacteriota bacterium]|nr:hypothetical protein [Acidobacteriota bacterium]